MDRKKSRRRPVKRGGKPKASAMHRGDPRETGEEELRLPRQLRQEIERLGLSIDDLLNTDLGDARTLAKAESAQILSKRYLTRHRVKKRLESEQEDFRRRLEENRSRRVRDWKQKTEMSPFHTDLVAEHERIDEENRVLCEEAMRREETAQRRLEQAKNDIVLQALEETSDLDALRKEKRAILQEERRIKALLGLEKMKNHRKKNLLAAQRAERQRTAAKLEFRRNQFLGRLQEIREKDHELLKLKLDVPEKPESTFQTYDTDHALGDWDLDAEDRDDALDYLMM